MSRRFIVILTAFVLGLAIGVILIREPMHPFTNERLAQATQTWRKANISDYEIRYTLNDDEYNVRVEDDIVTSITVDGEPPRGADLQSYTVDGLFRVLVLEIENLTDPQGPFAAQGNSVIARVRFNPQFGYVERYIRSAGGLGRGAHIETLEFNPDPRP